MAAPEALLLAGLPLTPLFAFILSGILGKPLREASWVARLSVLGYGAIIDALAVVEINVHFDRTQPEVRTFVVTARRSSDTRYFAEFIFEQPTAWPRLYGPRAGWDRVFVGATECYRLTPGKSRVTIEIHRGALSLPWFHRRQYKLDFAD